MQRKTEHDIAQLATICRRLRRLEAEICKEQERLQNLAARQSYKPQTLAQECRRSDKRIARWKTVLGIIDRPSAEARRKYRDELRRTKAEEQKKSREEARRAREADRQKREAERLAASQAAAELKETQRRHRHHRRRQIEALRATGETLEAIGNRLGISKQRVHAIVTKNSFE